MIRREEILLLDIIENSGNIKKLLRENISYKEISEIISKLVREELLCYIDKKIILTDIGKDMLKNGKNSIKETDKNLWIEAENESRIKIIEKNFIFLPNQKELDF